MEPECDAGKTAFFGGAWKEPCSGPAEHRIGSPGRQTVIHLCQAHFDEVSEALPIGPPISEKEFWQGQLQGPS